MRLTASSWKSTLTSMAKGGEQDIQNEILKYLTSRGYTCWRQNTAGIYDTRTNRFRKPSRFAVNGVSDIIVLSEGKAYFIEVKTPKGIQSEDQRLFQEFVERADCEYLLARSLADVQEAGF